MVGKFKPATELVAPGTAVAPGIVVGKFKPAVTDADVKGAATAALLIAGTPKANAVLPMAEPRAVNGAESAPAIAEEPVIEAAVPVIHPAKPVPVAAAVPAIPAPAVAPIAPRAAPPVTITIAARAKALSILLDFILLTCFLVNLTTLFIFFFTKPVTFLNAFFKLLNNPIIYFL